MIADQMRGRGMKRRFHVTFGVLILAVVLFAGCGADGASVSPPTITPSPTATVTPSPTATAGPSAHRIPLNSWYADGRGDNFATTDPQYTPGKAIVYVISGGFASYYWYRLEGTVFSPEDPQPAGTIPLNSWFSHNFGDNYCTSNPSYTAGPGAYLSMFPFDYKWVRLEGYVFDPVKPQPAGTVPLNTWFSLTRGDFFSTTDPQYTPGKDIVYSTATYNWIRLEGYIFAP